MGDRHGGCFARRGRALNPHRPQVDAPLGESLPTRRTSKRICPTREGSPRRKPPDTAHERKDLPRAGTRPSAKVSRHGARAKGFVPRENALLGESLPTRRTSERICPAQERSPRRKHPDTAHERRDLPRAGIRPAAKASRHGAKAKGFVPRRNTPLDESIPTRRTSERICAAQEHAPQRRPPDTAHERRDLSRAGTRPSAKASRHGARAKEFAPRRNTPLGESLPTQRKGERICPAQEHAPRRRHPDTARRRKNLSRGVRVRPTCRRTAGRPRSTDSQKNTPSAGSHPQRAAAAEFIHLKK